ncbi:SusC/RagA family TonB-linked outer membrane protein [Chitinophaga tropicalis]|uniref:SusC/RagA family TonB-linked outer membrane protein n=1 Tax=Chitinophaga tropicalis TaxID=2683588 RepID=A0A7K1U3A1_9BACT|nr:TonB-dependent receptor [Chitinophaga tropicalis]MVT08790.1 SusC/RagA family TonB-linked outer membrane protein [Chitinophaga tropicalis]
MRRISLLLFLILLPVGVIAQQLIKARVLNNKKEPVAGASVSEMGNSRNGIATDEYGYFQLRLSTPNAKLVITAVGYLPNTVAPVNGQVITLSEEAKDLGEVLVVAYGRQNRITNTGAVSTVKAAEVKSIPTSSIQNTLVGRLPGFFSQQRSGQPGSDAAEFFIRGVNSLSNDNRPLIIVDDIEYTYEQLAQINVNEIASVTILKDAATTAVYGIRGANGVLVVTTNRGAEGKPQINVTAEYGMNRIIRLPTYLGSYQTALLMNEATLNDAYGQSITPALPWTEEDLRKFRDGSDPYGHPNVNWQRVLLNKTTFQSRYNVDVTGGNRLVKYFTSLGYYSQNGILKQFAPTLPGDDVNNNYYYRRFNFRSNLDITPTNTLKIRFDINGRFETVNNPGGVQDAGGLFKELQAFRAFAPFVMPLRNPDGSYGYANQTWGNGYANPITRLANGGYIRNFKNNFNIVIGADQKLDFITNGLSAKFNVSYATNINENRNLTRDLGSLPVFYYNPENNTYTPRNASNYKMPAYILSTGSGAFNNRLITQLSVNYSRSFGVHNIYGLALLNQNSYADGGNIPTNFRGLTGRIGYDFNRKYLLEFNIARNGSDKFVKRYGWFPALSAGWNISGEQFFKDLFPFVDLLKVRGSYGLVGSDVNAPTVISTEIQYSLPTGPFGAGATEGALVNPNVTWEKERKTNVGVDLNLWKSKLSLTADYFYNYRYDQLISQGDVPVLIGQTLPSKNIGITENRGFDGILTYQDQVGEVDFSIGANVSYAKNRIIYISEAPDYPHQARTGRAIGQTTLGYVNRRFYQPEEFDVNGKIKEGIAKPLWSTLQPGDLKYADLNGDGVITTADMTYLSKPNLPTTTYGINLTMNYKGLYLRALLQGAFGYAVQINAEGADAFNSNLRPWHLERWTPETAATATYPRIGRNTNINNISWQTVSDFWFVDASYMRLKSVELGYQVPGKFMRKSSFIKNTRIYAAGYNLATFRKLGRFDVDPEIASGQGQAYPMMANYILGIQLGM